jgi:hypothetical protein
MIEEDFKGLRALQGLVGARLKCGMVLHAGREILPFGPRLWAVPIQALWARRLPGKPLERTAHAPREGHESIAPARKSTRRRASRPLREEQARAVGGLAHLTESRPIDMISCDYSYRMG